MTDTRGDKRIKKPGRGAADRVAVRTDQMLWRMAERLPFLRVVVERRERKLAKEQCAIMLDICRALQDDDPTLRGEALYERAIARRLSCDGAKARDIVRLADQSFAQWPQERDVEFRDVVNCLLVNQILLTYTTALGTRTDMKQIVDAAIPKGL